MFILTSSPIHPSIHPSIHYFVRHTCSKHPSANHYASCYETCNELYDIYAKLINKYLLIICYVPVFLGSEVQQWIRWIIPPLIELLYSNSSGPWTQPSYKTVWERITTNVNNEIPMLCSVSQSVTSDSLWPHELQPSRLLCPWDSPGKNTGVGCRGLLQEILPTCVSYI